MKSASDGVSFPELTFSSKRLVYRWLVDCQKQNTILEVPSEIEEWMDLADGDTMFSPSKKVNYKHTLVVPSHRCSICNICGYHFVDVAALDTFSHDSVVQWFETSRSHLCHEYEYHHGGTPSIKVARLIFADFPTSMVVHELARWRAS
ncbi:hypothetical protein GOP47_0008429 [Adiantum capillus-veneris]|uniref:Uncharacterized protein n=1 Tax=Adiantum capillus-veneris TaxID=13818 RepID=A0A9D4UYP3_ADICA|nr:hypothetical protein GOP47_0008429 [Adiantum capillus-veneris]